MKKIKEFLLLFVPFALLTVVPYILFVNLRGENAFMGNAQYLRLLLNDGIFWNAVFNTYCIALIFSVLAVLCVAVLCRFIKRIKSRKIFYPVSIALASIVAFLSIYLKRVNYFGLPMGVYDPEYLISGSRPPVSVSFFDVLLALQIGVLTVLLFWLAETVIFSVKSRKSV